MSVGDTFGWFAYQSDDQTLYNVRLSNAVAGAAFFAPSTKGQFVKWPYLHKDMRHLCGNHGPGKGGRIPIGNASDPRFKSAGGTWTVHGLTYTVTGALGERRPGIG